MIKNDDDMEFEPHPDYKDDESDALQFFLCVFLTYLAGEMDGILALVTIITALVSWGLFLELIPFGEHKDEQ